MGFLRTFESNKFEHTLASSGQTTSTQVVGLGPGTVVVGLGPGTVLVGLCLTFLWLTIFMSRSSLNALFAYVSF